MQHSASTDEDIGQKGGTNETGKGRRKKEKLELINGTGLDYRKRPAPLACATLRDTSSSLLSICYSRSWRLGRTFGGRTMSSLLKGLAGPLPTAAVDRL